MSPTCSPRWHSEAAIWINAPVALSAALGTFATGWLATRIYHKYPGALAWIPGVGLLLSITRNRYTTYAISGAALAFTAGDDRIHREALLQGVGQGMADKPNRNLVPLVEARFEGKQGQHLR